MIIRTSQYITKCLACAALVLMLVLSHCGLAHGSVLPEIAEAVARALRHPPHEMPPVRPPVPPPHLPEPPYTVPRFPDNFKGHISPSIFEQFPYAPQAAEQLSHPAAEELPANRQRADTILRNSAVLDHEPRVYVERDQGRLYYRSNFKSANASHNTVLESPRPNKAFTDTTQVLSALDLKEQYRLTSQGPLYDLDMLVDVSMFDSNGRPLIDLSEIKRLQLVDAHANKVLQIQPEIMRTKQPPPALIAKIKGCCLYAMPPHFAAKFSEMLAKRPFKQKDTRIISLFAESATEREIANSPAVKSARLAGDAASLKSPADLQALINANRGKTVILLGHVEDGDYVIRTSAGGQQLRVAIDNVRDMAKKAGVRLIDLGCETVRAVDQSSVGVMGKYNSVKAIQSLELAMSSSVTMRDFLQNLSSEGLKLVLEPSFLTAGEQQHATIYAPLRNTWQKVAEITLSYFK